MLSHLPLFLRMAALVRHARLLRAMDLPDDQDYPAWLQALRRKLAHRIKSYPAALEGRSRSSVPDAARLASALYP